MMVEFPASAAVMAIDPHRVHHLGPEHERTIRPLHPVRELPERTAVRRIGQFGVRDIGYRLVSPHDVSAFVKR
jgi:hypothetical protein